VVCVGDPLDGFLPTGALVLLLEFAQRLGFFEPFREHFDVPIKTLDYAPLQKLQTLICSLAVGCDHIKDINHKLRPYVVAARLLGMEQFPEQSSISRFLRQLGPLQGHQLELIGELLLKRFGLWQWDQQSVLDVDSTGLMVYGRTYEFARKGYFPRQPGRRGYRLTVASTSGPYGPEILASFLDPANAHASGRLWDCLYQAAEITGSLDRFRLIRADAAFGTGPTIETLLELGLRFLLKGICNQTAHNLAANVEPTQWEPLDLFTRVCDLGPRLIHHCRYPVRVVLTELITERQDRRFYSHIYTNLPPSQADARQIFEGYNQRQCIEALIKSAKAGLCIRHLRSRRYVAIQNFLRLAAITFNLLAWFRYYLLAQLDLGDLGLAEITSKLMDIPAHCSRSDTQLVLRFPERHPLTSALCPGHPI